MTETLPPASPAPELGAPSPAPAPAGPKRGGRGAVVIVVGMLVFLAVVLFAVKDNQAAGDLKAGDCFDVPSATTVQTITRHACTEAHTAEAFHVATYTGDDSTYPISLTFGRFADEACTPVFQSYVGAALDARPDLAIGYFYPSRDGWGSGDRAVTCYVVRADDGTMTQSVKGSGTP